MTSFSCCQPFFIWIDSWNVHKKLVDFCKNWHKVFQSSKVLLHTSYLMLKIKKCNDFSASLKMRLHSSLIEKLHDSKRFTLFKYLWGNGQNTLISYDHLWSTLKLLLYFAMTQVIFLFIFIWKMMPIGVFHNWSHHCK